MACACGSGREKTQCCESLLNGERMAGSPEELMRSRYMAFVHQNIDYLLETTDPQTRMEMDLKASAQWAQSCQFLKLEVIRSSQEGNKGLVEFKAFYQVHGQEAVKIHHEVSKFRKQGGLWYFREGRVLG